MSGRTASRCACGFTCSDWGHDEPAWSAYYDGDGVRLGQVINGEPITYYLYLVALPASEQLTQRTT